MALRLVTFDATHTLITFTKSIGSIYLAAANRHDVRLACRDDVLDELFKKEYKRMWKEYPNFGVDHDYKPDEWWEELTGNVYKSAGAMVDMMTRELLCTDLYKEFASSNNNMVLNGVPETLNQIKKEYPHLQLGVISNHDERLEDILAALGLVNYFAFILTSVDARCAKPDPDIFVEATYRLGRRQRLDPSECCHIGDDATNDYFGPKSAGWNTLLLSKGSPSGVPKEDLIRNFKDIPRVIKRFL